MAAKAKAGKKKRGRPRKDGPPDSRRTFRLPPEMAARVDAYVDRLRAERPGEIVKWSQAARSLLEKGLQSVGL